MSATLASPTTDSPEWPAPCACRIERRSHMIQCPRLLTVVLITSAAWCASEPIRAQRRVPSAPSVPVAAAALQSHVVNLRISPAVQDKGHRVLIEGFTNLPDDALVAYEVEHELFFKGHIPLLESDRYSKEDRRAAQEKSLKWMYRGHIPVKAGRFIQALDIREWPAGRIKVWVAFQTILGTGVKQPAKIIARYGQMGERIKGNQVTMDGPMRRVEVERTVIKK